VDPSHLCSPRRPDVQERWLQPFLGPSSGSPQDWPAAARPLPLCRGHGLNVLVQIGDQAHGHWAPGSPAPQQPLTPRLERAAKEPGEWPARTAAPRRRGAGGQRRAVSVPVSWRRSRCLAWWPWPPSLRGSRLIKDRVRALRHPEAAVARRVCARARYWPVRRSRVVQRAMTKPGAPLKAPPFSLVPLRASDVEGGDSYGLMPWRASRPPFGHQPRPQHSGCLSQNPADDTVRFCSSKGGCEATSNSQHDWQLPVLAPGGAVRHP